MDWFIKLSVDEQQFIKEFILSSGSLKQLAKIYDVSYPTVRLRIDRIIEKILLIEEEKADNFISSLMQMVIDEKLDLTTAKMIIENYERSVKNE